MSETKHAYRLMVIDIEEDKVVIDEFCDCIVGGVGKKVEEEGKTGSAVLVMQNGWALTGVAAVEAAEKAVKLQKRKLVTEFLKTASPEEIAEVIKKGREVDNDELS